MVLHDKDGVLKKYESPKQMIEEFYEARWEVYKLVNGIKLWVKVGGL